MLQDLQEKWLNVAGINTRYLDAGEGDNPIVFIHGGRMGDVSIGASAEDWRANVQDLAKDGRVLAFDRLGQGFTDNPNEDCDCTMGGSVRHARAFLRALNAGPYNLVGHGRGGYIAGAIALSDPGLVNACVIAGSASAAPGESRGSILLAANPHQPGSTEFTKFHFEHCSSCIDFLTEEWLNRRLEIARTSKNRQMSGRMSTLLAARLSPEFVEDRDRFFAQIDTDGFRRPVMLVWGYIDPVAPLQMGLDLFDRIAARQKRTSMHVINQGGHYCFLERTASFNKAISDFFKGVGYGE